MSTSNTATATVGVIGIGNRLMRDEGLGVRAIEKLHQQEPPEGAELIDGGTDPWSAFSAAEGCSSLLLLDAVMGGDKPGAIYRMPLDEVETGVTVLSLHGITLFHLLQYERLLGNTFEEVIVLGMEPELVEPGIGLSETCEWRMDEFIRMVREEVKRLRSA